jgi:uncharacterized protein YjbI with pentapeptide repeats
MVEALNAFLETHQLTPSPQDRVEIGNTNFEAPFRLSGLRIPIGIYFRECHFREGINLESCTIASSVEIRGGTIRGLSAKDVTLNGTISVNNLDLADSKIVVTGLQGGFQCNGLARVEGIRVQGPAIRGIHIGNQVPLTGAIDVSGSTFTGQIDLGGFGVGGNLTEVNVSKCTFTEEFVTSGRATFSCPVNFNGSVFRKSAAFGPANFTQRVDFSNAVFEEGVALRQCVLLEGIDFSHCTVSGGRGHLALFSGLQMQKGNDEQRPFTSTFAETTFHIPTRFDQASFQSAVTFQKSKFMAGLSLHGSFVEPASFSEAELRGPAEFNGATSSSITFEKATAASLHFEGYKFLGETTFSNLRCDSLNLTHAVFAKALNCDHAVLGTLVCNNVTFKSRTDFSHSRFTSAPQFHGATFFQNTYFHSADFQDVSADAEGAYRTLKQAMADLDNNYAEMLFGAFELDCRRKRLEWRRDFWEKLISLLYWATNSYGRRFMLPLAWLFVLLSIGAVAYSLHESIVPDPALSLETLNRLEGTWMQPAITDQWQGCYISARGLYFSVFNTLGPLRLLSTYSVLTARTPFTQLASLGQLILATILWYVLIVGIRRRFKTLS